MKKVFIIHGFEGSPNGGWRPWLMAELEKNDVYSCALAMPNPATPICDEWIAEIARHVEDNSDREIYLVGHSLGGSAILRFLEQAPDIQHITGVVLVSSPAHQNDNRKIDSFLKHPFNFDAIRRASSNFVIIHGNNDPYVPLDDAKFLADKLNGQLIIIPNGGHLNGSSGWFALPECLEVLNKMFR